MATVSLLMFVAGAWMFSYPFATDLYAQHVVQRPLEGRFVDPGLRRAYLARAVPTGDPLTRIRIPAISVEAIVVEGTSPEALRAGAGHYPDTPLPGEEGNVAIAGHRTTYGKPFGRLEALRAGDLIELETPLQTHMYRVVEHPPGLEGCPSGACWITAPDDWGVVRPTAMPTLTLTTCHPKGSASQRLILRAELARSVGRRS
ncbi:MAG: class E sortase [Egibacteraceae bacterium]